MCKSKEQGGQRCSAHARTKFRATPATSPDWHQAAVEFASTPAGKKEFTALVTGNVAANTNHDQTAHLRSILTQGQTLREATRAAERAIANARFLATLPSELFAPPGTLLEAVSGYAEHSTWATWETTNPTNAFTKNSSVRFPYDDPAVTDTVHSRVIVVGLNPGSDGIAMPNWSNFHAGKKHNDHLLAEAFRDTPGWGGYMTDLYDTVESDSGLIRPPREKVTSAVKLLVTQAKLIKADNPVIVCLGTKAHTGVTKNIAVLQEGLNIDNPIIVGVPHYSTRNHSIHANNPTKYRDIVAQALDEPYRRAGL